MVLKFFVRYNPSFIVNKTNYLFFSAADLVASIVGASSSAKRELSTDLLLDDEGRSQKKKVKLSDGDQDEGESKSSDEVEEVNEDDKLAIRQVVVVVISLLFSKYFCFLCKLSKRDTFCVLRKLTISKIRIVRAYKMFLISCITNSVYCLTEN